MVVWGSSRILLGDADVRRAIGGAIEITSFAVQSDQRRSMKVSESISLCAVCACRCESERILIIYRSTHCMGEMPIPFVGMPGSDTGGMPVEEPAPKSADFCYDARRSFVAHQTCWRLLRIRTASLARAF